MLATLPGTLAVESNDACGDDANEAVVGSAWDICVVGWLHHC